MNIFSNISNKYLTASNSFLLTLVIFTVFFIPFFPIQWHRFLYNLFFTLIFLLSTLALSKYRTKMLLMAFIVILIVWISDVLNLSALNALSFLTNILFFDFIVVLLILQIASSKTVTLQVILESINAYLMLGLSFSILISLVCVIDPGAFSFKHLATHAESNISYFSDYTYYGFVTLTTLGYGDIAPLTPVAKSLSNFISITGQLYVAIIIAALVSKYLGQKNSN